MGKLELSVVMPNYNHGRFISEAIETVLSQSYRPKELIILDDGSTDNSVEIIEKYARKDPTIRFYRNDKNEGLFPAFHKLFTHVTCEYLFCTASDDRILPGFFEKAMRLLEKYPQAGLCCCDLESIDEQGNHISKWLPVGLRVPEFVPPQDLVRYLRKGWMIFPPIYKVSAFQDAGTYIPDVGPYGDCVASVITASSLGACYLPESFISQRILPTQYSRQVLADPGKTLKVFSNIIHVIKCRSQDGKVSKELLPFYIDYFSRRMGEFTKSFFYVHQEKPLEELKKLWRKQDFFDEILYRIIAIAMMVERQMAFFCCLRHFKKEIQEASKTIQVL